MNDRKHYVSPYDAYPFLREPGSKLLCDFELATDRLSSGTGYLRALMLEEQAGASGAAPTIADDLTAWLGKLPDELLWVTGMIYHLNACLRTRFTLTDEEFAHLLELTRMAESFAGDEMKQFLLPAGTAAAMKAHELRVDAKSLVRLLYRWSELGHPVDCRIFDWANLLSGFFFAVALTLNQRAGVSEIAFTSRNYSI